jgi:hypothetical protein
VTDIEYKKKQIGTIPSFDSYAANIQKAIAADSQ